jgi:hypothetical protein
VLGARQRHPKKKWARRRACPERGSVGVAPRAAREKPLTVNSDSEQSLLRLPLCIGNGINCYLH